MSLKTFRTFFLATTLSLLILHIAMADPVPSDEDLPPQASVKTPVEKKVVIIDPGHGGPDIGSVGIDRLREKDLTLTLSKMIEKKLSKKYKTILTRKSDSTVDLKTRTETADKARADLMISLHAGGGFLRDFQGIGLYYCERRGISVEADNPGQAGYGSGASRAVADWRTVQARYLSLSRTLAMIMNEHIASRLSGGSPGKNNTKISVDGLPLIVLEGADMPALLIEVGCLSNPSVEKNLKSNEYLLTLADGICSGIDAFFEQYPDKIIHEF
jgi:N-acetylmuramoyl-L-alanine amidase